MFHSYFERKNDKVLTFNIIHFPIIHLPLINVAL